jgi:hypothetical protein
LLGVSLLRLDAYFRLCEKNNVTHLFLVVQGNLWPKLLPNMNSVHFLPLGTQKKISDDPATWLDVSKHSPFYHLVMLFNHEAYFQAIGPFHSKMLYLITVDTEEVVRYMGAHGFPVMDPADKHITNSAPRHGPR